MAVADTFDALTSNRSYHNSRSVAEAIEILLDSSGYDFDPKVVKAMVSWIQKVHNQLGQVNQLTLEDLLDSQKHSDHNSMAEIVDDTCVADD
jgi:HD-GYP domain-containing protein (c-di-GMP phosphodiesterase class II)